MASDAAAPETPSITAAPCAPPSQPRLRRATAADADAVCAFGRQAFCDTFAHLYSKADLDHYLNESYTPAVFAAYVRNSLMALFVAEDKVGDAILGYSLAGPVVVPHAEAWPADGELRKLYVAQAAKGTGIAQALLALCVEWVRGGQCCASGPGHERARTYLSVWSENRRALAFYRRAGFAVVGEYLYEVGEARDLELIMRLE